MPLLCTGRMSIIGGFLFYAECVHHLTLRLIRPPVVGCIDYTRPALVSPPSSPHHYFSDQQGSPSLGSQGAVWFLLVPKPALLRHIFIISASSIGNNSTRCCPNSILCLIAVHACDLQRIKSRYKGAEATSE